MLCAYGDLGQDEDESWTQITDWKRQKRSVDHEIRSADMEVPRYAVILVAGPVRPVAFDRGSQLEDPDRLAVRICTSASSRSTGFPLAVR